VEFGGGLGWLGGSGGSVAVRVFGVGSRGPGHDQMAQGGRGCEDAVVGELVFAWVWEDRDEALDENEGVEAKGLGAVAPGGAEFPWDLAVVGEGEAALGERWAGNVPAEALAQGAVVCGYVGGLRERE
jgi:hypothetical protein